MVTLTKGAQMPLLGLGTWLADESDAYESVRYALEVGYRHVDTATMYRNEKAVGRAVRESGVPRSEVFLTTKLPPDRAERADETIEASLTAMGLDYVDLWLIHWPVHGDASPETWLKLLGARERGLTKEVGVSNYSLRQLDELERATGELPAVNQIEWGPDLFDADELAGHQQRGVVLEGYSPFKSTDLESEALASIASAHAKTAAQIVLAWHLQHGVVAIPKSTNQGRIAANFDVLDILLTTEEMSSIDELGL